jgi:outer membrane protein assembly factor BamE (lipoprotein component of BamABCDE complex)
MIERVRPRGVAKARAMRAPLARGLGVLGLVLLLAGCVIGRDTTNEPLEREAVLGLQPGVTTASEVVELLGAPSDVVQLGWRSAYRYDFTQRKRTGLFLIVLNLLNDDTRSDRVWLFFDEDQRLTHYGATFAGDQPQYAMPWQPVHGPDTAGEEVHE